MRAGEAVEVDFGVPDERQPGFPRSAVVVTADRILQGQPRCTVVSPKRVRDDEAGNVGAASLAAVRSVPGDLLDIR